MSDQHPREANSLPVDVVVDLLGHRRRRIVLALLATHGRKLTLNDLTKETAAREHEAPITDVSGEELTRIATSLYHVHVPKLADAGVVVYDETRRIVEPTGELDHLEPYLTAALSDESPS